MSVSRSEFHFVYLVAIGLIIGACCRDLQGTQVITPTDSPPLQSTGVLEAVKPGSIATEPIPKPTRQSVVATPTAPYDNIQVSQVTEQDKIAGVRWSDDGQSVVYATWGEHRGVIDEWWEYKISTRECYLVEPPFELDPQLWIQLAASHVDEVFTWFGGGLSPSGARVVYSRLPPAYNHIPAPDDFSLPPYEAWTAHSDGSDAVRLQSCPNISQAIWLDQERKILLVCSYEGGGGVSIASIDGNPPVDPLEGLTLSHWVALSPDETKLAFPDAFGTLHIAFLDSGEIQAVAQWGYLPNWAIDSHRLYYQQKREFTDRFVDIRVYDLDTGTDTLLVPSSIHTSGSIGVSVPMGTFAVSPLENSAVFENRGLWLVTWSP